MDSIEISSKKREQFVQSVRKTLHRTLQDGSMKKFRDNLFNMFPELTHEELDIINRIEEEEMAYLNMIDEMEEDSISFSKAQRLKQFDQLPDDEDDN